MHFILSLIFISSLSLAQTNKAETDKSKELPTLKTKQSLNNIRFISNDGKFTYYQRRSGDLQLSKNYSNFEVLKKEQFTEYFIHSSSDRKKLLIEVDDSFHTEMSFMKMNELYIVDFGKDQAKKIGEGAFPKLHLKDSYFSYLDLKKQEIHYQKVGAEKESLKIKLNNNLNSFYIPYTQMLTNYEVLYTDINNAGQNAILMYSVLDKKSQPIYKSTLPGGKVEYCVMDNNLYIGEFSFGDIQNNSKIIQIPLFENKNFKKLKVLYQSQQSDIGNMNCDEGKIYFIKTLSYNKKLNLKHTEIATYDIKENKTKILTNLKYVTQLIKVDDMIVSPFRGDYYLIKGDAKLTQDEIKQDKAIEERDLNR